MKAQYQNSMSKDSQSSFGIHGGLIPGPIPPPQAYQNMQMIKSLI